MAGDVVWDGVRGASGRRFLATGGAGAQRGWKVQPPGGSMGEGTSPIWLQPEFYLFSKPLLKFAFRKNTITGLGLVTPTMLTPAHDLVFTRLAAAARCGCCRWKLGSWC